MYKAYKFRLYPTDEQREKMNKNFGCSRFVYNHYLDFMKENGIRNKFENIKDYTHSLQHEYPFLQEADSFLIRTALFHAVYSSYKDRHYCNIEVDLINRKIKLPKLKWISIRGYRNTSEIKGKIVNATVSREKNNKYYVSVIYEISIPKKTETPTRVVGLDVGVKALVTLSDGTFIENNRYLSKYEKRIKRIQRELSRKVKRSNNYYKCKHKLAVLYSKLATLEDIIYTR